MGAPNYSRHARRRLRQRHITEAEVEAVLASHDTDRPDVLPGRRLLTGNVGGRRITVVVVEATAADPLVVVTVWD